MIYSSSLFKSSKLLIDELVGKIFILIIIFIMFIVLIIMVMFEVRI